MSLLRCPRGYGRALATVALLVGGAQALEAQTVTAMWDPNSESDLAGYVLHYGTQSGQYSVNIDVGNQTSRQVGLTPGPRYYFAVRAYNTSQLFSPYSAEAVFDSGSPNLTNPGNQSTPVGGTVSLQLVASDPNGDVLTYSATGLPPGLTVNSATGRISGAVAPASAGNYTVTATVSDGSLSDSETFIWTITNGNSAPTLTNPGNPTNAVGSVVSLQLVASDPDGDTLIYSAAGLPPALTVNTVTGLISGTLTNAGVYTVTATASDGSLSSSRTFTWTVTNSLSLTVSPTTVSPGGTITVTIANGPGNAGDWVGLYPVTNSHSGYLQYKYLNGLQTPPPTGMTGATLTFPAPSAPGTYNVRMFANASYALLATSVAVTVSAPSAPSITVSPTSVPPGGTMTVTIGNGPGNRQDWVGLYPTTNSHSGWLEWKYLNGLQTQPPSGLTGATLTFTMPTTPAPGTYNLRLFANGSYTLLATSVTITQPPVTPPTVTVTPTTVAGGGTITVTFANGPGNRGDWVGLYATSAAHSGYLAWKYLNGTQTMPPTGITNGTVTFTVPTTPGTYNVRFFKPGLYNWVATSNTFTVQ